MEPGLPSGALVAVASRRIYLPGDLLAFSRNGSLYVHRFLGYVWWRRWLLLTQADRAPRWDGPVEPRWVLGRVCGGHGLREAARPGLGVRLQALVRWLRACASTAARKRR